MTMNPKFFSILMLTSFICSTGAFSLAISRNQDIGSFVDAAEPFKNFVGTVHHVDAAGKSSWQGTGSLAQIGGATFGITAAHCVAGSDKGYIEVAGKRYPYDKTNLHLHPAWQDSLLRNADAPSVDFAFFPISPQGVPEGAFPQIKPVTLADFSTPQDLTLSGYGQAGRVTGRGVEMASPRNTYDIPAPKAGTQEAVLAHDKQTEKYYAALPGAQRDKMKTLGLQPFPYYLQSTLRRDNYDKLGFCTSTPGDSGAPVFDGKGHVVGVHSFGSHNSDFRTVFRDKKTESGHAPITKDLTQWMRKTVAAPDFKLVRQ